MGNEPEHTKIRGAEESDRVMIRNKSGRITAEFADAPRDPRRLAADLAAAIEGQVRFGDGDRALYATDASNYRQVPAGVVIPRNLEDVRRVVTVCRTHGVPIISRGVERVSSVRRPTPAW